MGALDRWAKVALEFVKRLPFHKLSANQTFDVACDALAVALAIPFCLKADVGPLEKLILALATLGFIGWSLDRNRIPIPPSSTRANRRQPELKKPPEQLSE